MAQLTQLEAVLLVYVTVVKYGKIPLRLPDSYDAKIAKIWNLWTFWPVIQSMVIEGNVQGGV